ncbi:unnamed protein product [Alopecurus aequalis]
MFHWSHMCDFEDVTSRGPMSHTEIDKPYDATMLPCLEIYSWKVTELRGGLRWPLDVFGFVALRDSLDHKRNFIFNRARDDPQRLTATDSSLELTGPVRAVQLCMGIEAEFELRVRGETPSEDRILSIDFWAYDPVRKSHKRGASRTSAMDTKFSTMVFTFSHLAKAVEATIQVKIVQGSWNFSGRFVAQMGSIDEEVVLIDTMGRPVPVKGDGVVQLCRRVVVVDGGGVLQLRVKASSGQFLSEGCDNNVFNVSATELQFTAKGAGTSSGMLDIGFAKMSVTVFWSLLPMV